MKKIVAVFTALALLLSLCAWFAQQAQATWEEQYDLGIRYLSEGNYEEAIIAFSAAIEINPKRASAYVGRGDAYARSEDTAANRASAKADYQKAIELDETLEEAYVGLADVYVRQGDLNKAKEILQEGADRAESSGKIKEKLEELGRTGQPDQPDQLARSEQTDRSTHESQRVEDIRFSRFEEQGKEYAVITGINSTGGVQWTYRTMRSDMTELTHMEEIGRTNGLYYFNERGTIVALDPDSGEVVWKNEEFGGCSISFDFAPNGDLFLCGYYGPDFFRVDANGKTIKRIQKVDERYFWPSELWYRGGYVEITMGGPPDGDGDHIVTVSLEENTQADASAWRQAYLRYIRNEDANPYVAELLDSQFQLIYVDGDDIPELWVCCSNIAAGALICTFDGEGVNDMFISEYGNLKYIEGSGQFYTDGGHMDVYWDGIYMLRNGQFIELSHGNFGAEDNANVQYDENGEPVYVYNWDGRDMTEQEYEAELAKAFDVFAARDVFDSPMYDYYQIQQVLSE